MSSASIKMSASRPILVHESSRLIARRRSPSQRRPKLRHRGKTGDAGIEAAPATAVVVARRAAKAVAVEPIGRTRKCHLRVVSTTRHTGVVDARLAGIAGDREALALQFDFADCADARDARVIRTRVRRRATGAAAWQATIRADTDRRIDRECPKAAPRHRDRGARTGEPGQAAGIAARELVLATLVAFRSGHTATVAFCHASGAETCS